MRGFFLPNNCMPMIVTNTIQEIREAVFQFKKEGKKVGFVPTMGALHSGHLSLIRTMRKHADAVVTSVFVNPTQFGPNEDYDAYPRQIESDLEKCRSEEVAAVFLPTREEMYSEKQLISFQLTGLGDHLCGKSRPGHFHGVIQVVNKLFNIVQPDAAIFGQKDIQQFYVLKRMATEFNHGITILMGETMRETDGLAMSSRNAYLSEIQRKQAPLLYKNLQVLASKIEAGTEDFAAMSAACRDALKEAGFVIDYLTLVDDELLQPVNRHSPGDTAILAIAAYLGKTRLIDNIILS